MRLRLLAASVLFAVVGCDKGADNAAKPSTSSTGTASAKPSSSASSPASATTVAASTVPSTSIAPSSSAVTDDVKAEAEKLKATVRPKDAKKEAVKGGSPGDDKKGPSKDAKKTDTDDATTSSPEKVADAPKGVCDGVPDYASKCDGTMLRYCAGGTEYQVDCEKAAKATPDFKFDTGACFETDDEVDCLGCWKKGDKTVCCDPQDDYCCDDDGYCWDVDGDDDGD